jgi:hypothetical protein
MTAVDSGAASPAAPRTGSGSAAPYPYSLPGIVKFSCAVHLLGGGCLAVQPSSWPWVLGSVALNHGAIAIGGLLPRSRWLGENWTRLPEPAVQRGEVAITLDDGPDPDVTPRVLDLLGQGGATASFFVIGQHAAAWPELVRATTASATYLPSPATGRAACMPRSSTPRR